MLTVWLNTAKDHKGPQRTHKGPQKTTKEHYTGPQRIGNTAKDPQRTAKERYGLSCRKLAPIELNGALYSSAHQDFSHAAGLSWEPALSDSQSVCRDRPRHLRTWKFHSSSQSSEASALRRWLEGAVRAASAARPTRCVLVGMRRRCCMARSNQHLLMAAWPSCTVQNPDAGKKLGTLRRPSAERTKQEAKTLINLCRGLKMVVS